MTFPGSGHAAPQYVRDETDVSTTPEQRHRAALQVCHQMRDEERAETRRVLEMLGLAE